MENIKHKHKDVVVTRRADGELVVTSRQVAGDFEKEPKHVNEVIRKLIAENSTVKNMIIESTYVSSRGREEKEYLLTRDGFSLLVMGFTGAKALQWKLKYIEAFNKMEQELKEPVKALSPMEMMELQFKVIKEQEQKIKHIDTKVERLEHDMPLFNIDCKEIKKIVNRKGVELLGGKQSPAYRDNSIRGRLYADIHQQLKREFGVTSYEAIKRGQLDVAKTIVEDYKAPICLINDIQSLNRQLSMEV